MSDVAVDSPGASARAVARMTPGLAGHGAEHARSPRAPRGPGAMRYAVALWWSVATIGHFLFAAYILTTYGKATLHGNMASWNRVWPTGYLPAQPLGNVMVVTHVLLASIVAICGPLQMVPSLRRCLPRFHRWNGRLYLATVIMVGAAGLAMLAVDRSFVGASQNGGVAINGVLLLACALAAWHFARKRDYAAHRRWALRTFVLSAGVWFFRIGLAAWIALNEGIAGFDPQTMQGTVLLVLAVAQWAVPLAVLEAYLWADRARTAAARCAVTLLVVISAMVTGYGIYRAAIGMWLPAMLA